MKRLLIPLLILCHLAISCDLMDQEPQLTLDTEELIFDAQGGLFDIPVESTASWKATAQPTTGFKFFSLLNAGGLAGKGTIRISMRPNPLAVVRAGVIKLVCSNEAGTQSLIVNVFQTGAVAYTKVSDWNEITVPSEGGSFSVTIESSTGYWGVICDDPEVQLNVKEGDYENPDEPVFYMLTVTVPANPSTEKRTFKLTLTDRPAQIIYQEYTFYQAQP